MNAAVLVISSKIVLGEVADRTRDGLEPFLRDHGFELMAYEVVKDNRQDIRAALEGLVDTANPHLLLTVGGTGVRPSDWAPEATRDVIEKEVPGIGEAMRSESFKTVRTAMLSRGTAGIIGTTLIINLPGNPKGARENLAVVMPILEHTVHKLSGSPKVVG